MALVLRVLRGEGFDSGSLRARIIGKGQWFPALYDASHSNGIRTRVTFRRWRSVVTRSDLSLGKRTFYIHRERRHPGVALYILSGRGYAGRRWGTTHSCALWSFASFIGIVTSLILRELCIFFPTYIRWPCINHPASQSLVPSTAPYPNHASISDRNSVSIHSLMA